MRLMDVIKQHFGVWHCKFNMMVRFSFRVRVSETYPRRRAGKRIPNIVKIPKSLDLIGYIIVLIIFICKFNVKNTPDSFKHVPDPF